MTAPARFQHFWYSYPDSESWALRELNLELGEGLSLLTGASGTGKTTVLRTLVGLVPHFYGGRARGRAEILGRVLERARSRQLGRLVSLVFQEPEAQMVVPVVEQEVAFGPAGLGLPAEEVRARVGWALEAFEISHLADRWVSQLSGGERQRVALAGAIAMRPAVLALDEPTSQLDPQGVRLLRWHLAAEISRGTAILVAEQRPERFQELAGREICLQGGLSGVAEGWPERRRASRGEVLLEARDLTVGHSGPVLSEVSLAVGRGEVLAVVGPNGGGKTTLLRTLGGLLPPLSGEVRRAPGRMAYLPQEPGAVLHQASVRREIAQTVRWLRINVPPDAIMERLGLTALADSDPRDLSGGQRQRAALAAVLVGSPPMALLDEPTRGADMAARRALFDELDLLTSQGAAVVIATSDHDFAVQVADRVLTIEDQRLVQGAPG